MTAKHSLLSPENTFVNQWVLRLACLGILAGIGCLCYFAFFYEIEFKFVNNVSLISTVRQEKQLWGMFTGVALIVFSSLIAAIEIKRKVNTPSTGG